MLKGQNEKLSNKKFYMWMLSGVLVVICICAVGLNITGRNGEKKQELADINKPIVENNVKTDDPANETDKIDDKANKDNASDDIANEKVNLLENDIVDDVQTKSKDVADSQKKESTDKKKDVEPESVSVMSNKSNIFKGLSFNEEEGLLWPTKGDVILNFSNDKVIYFATLGQYKCNDAIMISAKEGADVVSAAKGVVTKIYENEETGLTLEMAIDKDYYLTYGQLKDIKVKEGETLSAGQKFASVAKPTKYFVVEGSNLYFKAVQGEKAVNPMYILK